MVGTAKRMYSLPTVAQILGKTQAEVHVLAREKILTAVDPGTRVRRNKPIYRKWHFDPDEVDAYKAGGLEGVLAYRKRQRVKK